MITFNSAQLFLSTSYLCNKAVEVNDKDASSILRSFVPFELKTPSQILVDFKKTQNEYKQKNNYLHAFGQINMYAFCRLSPFLVDYVTQVNSNNRLLLSVCYGAKSTYKVFCHFNKNSTTKCVIQPIVHFSPNRIVSIIYSCFIEDSSNDGRNLIDAIRSLKWHFLNGSSRERVDIVLTRKGGGTIESFDSLTKAIQYSINKAIPEYDFSLPYSHIHYSFVHFLRGAYSEGVSREQFIQIASSVIHSRRVNSQRIEGESYYNYSLGKHEFYYHYITENEAVFLQSGCMSESNRKLRQNKHFGWSVFGRIENALSEKLLCLYFEYKARELSRCAKEAKRYKDPAFLKLSIFDSQFENMAELYLNSVLTMKTDSFSRMVIYSVYGSKENRKEFINSIANLVNQAIVDVCNHKSIFEKVKDSLGKIVPMLNNIV